MGLGRNQSTVEVLGGEASSPQKSTKCTVSYHNQVKTRFMEWKATPRKPRDNTITSKQGKISIPTDNRQSLTSDDYKQTDRERGRTDRQSGRTDRPIEHLRVYLSLSQSA